MMPAFSRPIDSRSVPRYSTWSMSMLVMTAQSASKALTASSRPPRPTSRIDQVERRRREQRRDRQHRELEVGQADVAARLLDRFEVRQQRRGVDALAADPAALLEVHAGAASSTGRRGSRPRARSIRASRRSSPCRWCRRRRSPAQSKARPSRALTAGDAVERRARSSSDAGARSARASRRGLSSGAPAKDLAIRRPGSFASLG